MLQHALVQAPPATEQEQHQDKRASEGGYAYSHHLRQAGAATRSYGCPTERHQARTSPPVKARAIRAPTLMIATWDFGSSLDSWPMEGLSLRQASTSPTLKRTKAPSESARYSEGLLQRACRRQLHGRYPVCADGSLPNREKAISTAMPTEMQESAMLNAGQWWSFQ